MIFYHFSEDPTITVFHPRTPPPRGSLTLSAPLTPEEANSRLVWAIDEANAPLFWFPRDCPRIAYRPLPTSTPDDLDRFFGHTAAPWIVAIESAWLERMRAVQLFCYRLPGDTFVPQGPHGGPGYHLSRESVVPLGVEPVGDLLARLAGAGIELRITPSLWPLRRALIPATLDFSMIRMRNAQPEADISWPARSAW